MNFACCVSRSTETCTRACRLVVSTCALAIEESVSPCACSFGIAGTSVPSWGLHPVSSPSLRCCRISATSQLESTAQGAVSLQRLLRRHIETPQPLPMITSGDSSPQAGASADPGKCMYLKDGDVQGHTFNSIL